MGKEHVAQLKHKDPEKRKAAIHAVAKDLNRDALKQLAWMCEDDPDKEVRSLARKAGVYIREQLGELRKENEPEKGGKDSKPAKIAVSEDDAKRAQAILNTALNYQIQGENARAMKYLAQALKVDPNLRHDPFFLNVASGVTGEEGQEAVNQISDVSVQKSTIEKESRQKLQKQISDHEKEISKATWMDVGFDFSLLAIIVLVGMTLVLFLSVQIAQGYVTKIETNRQMVSDATYEGRIVDLKETPLTYLSTELDAMGKPKKFQEITPDPALWTIANQLKPLTLFDLLPISLVVTLATVAVVFVMAASAHFLSQKLLQGIGRLPYFAHQTASLFLSRALILLILCGVGSMLIFEANGGTIVMIVQGLIGIFTLLAIFKLISITSKSYNFGFVQGLVAMLPGLLLAGALSGFVIF
jgi:tetratricopeptide (TPR) repeat protein